MRTFRKPRKIKQKKSILKNRFFWLTLLFLVMFGGILFFLTFSSFFQIEIIGIVGNERIPTESLETIVLNNVEKKILSFPTRSIFLVNSEKIEENILSSFPQIAGVETHRGFPKSLNIIIRERSAVAVFCQRFLVSENEQEPKEDNCFLIDEEGIIFEKEQPKKDLIKIIEGEIKDKTFVLGEQVFEKEYLGKILEIHKNFSEELKIEIREIFASNERLNIKTDEGWEIYFNPKEQLKNQLRKLTLILEQEIPLEKRGNLEYIDLRFTRVYYRYR